MLGSVNKIPINFLELFPILYTTQLIPKLSGMYLELFQCSQSSSLGAQY